MEDKKIIINDEEISYEDLSDESKYLYTHVVDINNQVEIAQFKMTQLQATKSIFEAEFIKSTQKSEEQE